MPNEIRNYADNRRIKELRYIFIDSLDVDPTFDTYREDYKYCKDVEGLFDQHVDLTPMIDDQTQWTTEYWDQLKIDLMDNFSEERFEHMIMVARYVYADKVSRLIAERNERAKTGNKEESNSNATNRQDVLDINDSVIAGNEKLALKTEEQQIEDIERKKRELEAANKLFEEQESAKRERKRSDVVDNNLKTSEEYKNGDSPKKAIGIVLIVAIVIIAIIIIYWCNP